MAGQSPEFTRSLDEGGLPADLFRPDRIEPERGIAGEQRGAEHDRWVRGVGAARNGRDQHGAVAHLGKRGHKLTIMSFTEVEQRKAKKWQPRAIVLGARNQIINSRGI